MTHYNYKMLEPKIMQVSNISIQYTHDKQLQFAIVGVTNQIYPILRNVILNKLLNKRVLIIHRRMSWYLINVCYRLDVAHLPYVV